MKPVSATNAASLLAAAAAGDDLPIQKRSLSQAPPLQSTSFLAHCARLLGGGKVIDTRLKTLSTVSICSEVARDTRALIHIHDQASHFVGAIAAMRSAWLNSDLSHGLDMQQRESVLEHWAIHLSTLRSLDTIAARYADYDQVKDPEARALAKGAYLAATAHRAFAELTTIDALAGDDKLQVVLDQAEPLLGLPPNQGLALKQRLTEPRRLAEYRQLRDQVFDHSLKLLALDESSNPAVAAAATSTSGFLIDSALARARYLADEGLRIGRLPDLLRLNRGVAATMLVNGTYDAVSAMGAWMSSVKVLTAPPMIKPAQARELLDKLQPGDLMLSRCNGFLSNLALPGFFKHMLVFVGRPEQLRSQFDGAPTVRALIQERLEAEGWQGTFLPETLSEYLAMRFPSKWAAFVSKSGAFGGETAEIVEAIPEGVVFTGAKRIAETDYVGAIRPKLSVRDRAESIIRLFEMLGQKYDFTFNFHRFDTQNCSKVGWLMVLLGQFSEGKGLDVEMKIIKGRGAIPPGHFLEDIIKRQGTGTEQFDVVAFLDGDPTMGKASFADAKTFLAAHSRPDYDEYK